MSDFQFRPDPKPSSGGGMGRKKAKKPLSREFIEAKAEKTARKKKCQTCRLCPNPNGWRIEPHHVVRRGAPHFGSWEQDNIVGLCLEDHSKYHSGDDSVKKALRLALTRAEVEHSDNAAFQGYVDKTYWPLPKDAQGQTTVGCELVAALKTEEAA